MKEDSVYFDTDSTPFIGNYEYIETPKRYLEIHSDVAYRIYLGKSVGEPCVVCVQDFDLKDYQDAWMLNDKEEIIQLLVYEYHTYHQDSNNPDEEARTLVEEYLENNKEEAWRQYKKSNKETFLKTETIIEKYSRVNDALTEARVASIYSTEEDEIYIAERCDCYFEHELTKQDCIDLSNMFKELAECFTDNTEC